MKLMIRLAVIAAGLAVSHGMLAQAPSGAPSGATGQCKDGTYTTSTDQSTACKGHSGVKTWYGSGDSTDVAPRSPGLVSPTAGAMSAPSATAKVAAGGGPGMVWLATGSKVYHCPGSRYYGTAKNGSYMTEAQAKAKGARPENNQPCTAN